MSDLLQRFAAAQRRQAENRREEERKAEQARDEARKKSIKQMAGACAQVPEFPVHAIVDFLRSYGTTQDFVRVRALSRSLRVPWDAFGGEITIGIVGEPNAEGNYTTGDLKCDFMDVATAHDTCSNATVVLLREFGFRDSNESVAPAFSELGFTDSDLSYYVPPIGPAAIRTVAFFGTTQVPGTPPSVPFEHLTILRLEGNVRMQQFTLSSATLRELSITRNKHISAVGFVGLLQLISIKLERCPYLNDIRMAGAVLESLSSLHIIACHRLNLTAAWETIDKLSSLCHFEWSDMLRHNNDFDIQSRLDFFKKTSGKVRHLKVERFSADTRCVRKEDLQPMQTVFDQALLHALEDGTLLDTLTVRGSIVFSALPIWHNTQVHSIDASSCKNLQQIFIYTDASKTNDEGLPGCNSSLHKLILNDCPQVETPQALSICSSLRHLSMQDCLLVTNDLLLNELPPQLEYLDLTGCKKIGGFDTELAIVYVWNENLKWCSFKSTAVCARDVTIWLLACPSLKYFNLSKLQLEGLSMVGESLETLLLMNVDLSTEFAIQCPMLKELWIGNAYRGWPFEHERQPFSRNRKSSSSSTALDGLSLANTVAAATVTKDKQLRIYLPEEISITHHGDSRISFSAGDFWTSSITSPMTGFYTAPRWELEKAALASSEIASFLRTIVPALKSQAYSIMIPEGPNPQILRGPHYKPAPPDADWHKDYSQIGLGHDGGYTSQLEWDWYE